VQKLYYQFRPDCYFWILVIICRKFGIAFTGLMFRKNPGFQLSVALLILFIAYALQVRYRPFQSPEDHANIVQDHAIKAMSPGRHAIVAAALRSVGLLPAHAPVRVPVGGS
jgi:hypothetical protein